MTHPARERLADRHRALCVGVVVFTGNGAHCVRCGQAWEVRRDRQRRTIGYVTIGTAG